MPKITKTTVDALEPRRRSDGLLTDGYIWDSEQKGFGCKATPGGRKVYIVQYRLGGRSGKTQRITLGVHGDQITAEEARKRAKVELGAVSDGKDPAEERRNAKRKLKTARSFEEVLERYLSANGKQNRSWGETRRLLQRDASRAFGKRDIKSITQADLIALIDDVATRSPSVARALFAALRPMFAWARPRGFIDSNPVEGLKTPPGSKARDRVLSNNEIMAFWQATEKLGWPFGPAFQLMLLTGQRENEVAGMEWSELDDTFAVWTLPGGDTERTKNSRAHAVDLSGEARAIIAGLPRVPCELGRSFIFSTTGRTPVSGFSKAKQRLDEIMSELPNGQIPPWRLHDLRRTAATGMAGLNVPPHVVERVINHRSGAQGGLTAVYQHHEYRAERRDALIRWGAKVATMVAGRRSRIA